MQINSINAKSVFYNKSLHTQKFSNVSFGNVQEDPVLQAAIEDTENILERIRKRSAYNNSMPMGYPFRMAEELFDILNYCDRIIQKRMKKSDI